MSNTFPGNLPVFPNLSSEFLLGAPRENVCPENSLNVGFLFRQNTRFSSWATVFIGKQLEAAQFNLTFLSKRWIIAENHEILKSTKRYSGDFASFYGFRG